MEDAVAALAAATKEAALAASAAKEAAVAASAAAKDAAAAASAANEAAAAAAVTAKDAAAAAKDAAAAAKEVAAVVQEAAAMYYSKKRKFHRIEDEGSCNCYRASLDLISSLPDAVLRTIISLLHTKDGVRTQAISRRWAPLWRSAPLNLVSDGRLWSKNHSTVELVSKILSDHPGPALRFSLKYINRRDCYDKIDGWLRSQALYNLQELEVHLYEMPYLLQLSTLHFAPTLRVAKFGWCHFPNLIAPPSLNFPCLKQLALFLVTISEDALHSMLSCCPALESLELRGIISISRLCIRSQTLRSIGFDTFRNREGVNGWQELVIEDAPCIERLLPLDPDNGPATIRIISAPKLEILGLLSKGISLLHFGTTIFQKMFAVSLTTKMHTMKVLILDSVGPNLHSVIDFLKCFPCLERLYVDATACIVSSFYLQPQPRKNMCNVRNYDPLNPIECMELHLKKVVLKNYDGGKSHFVDFAKFFILNAKVLNEMEIAFIKNHHSAKWIGNHCRELQVENRASRDAQINLKGGVREGFTHNRHTHDLLMADPFDISLCGCSHH